MAASEDDLDEYDARRYFGLSGRAYPEELCRVVLDRTGTGLDFSTLSPPQRAAMTKWAVALGSLGPTLGVFWGDRELATSESGAARAAREAARLTIEIVDAEAVEGLARRLLPSKPDASATAVLSALGRRVYDAIDRVVDEHNVDVADAERDAYSELAGPNPATQFVSDPDPEAYHVDDD